MVNRYPHLLQFSSYPGSEAYQDSEGNWVQPEATEIITSHKCRATTNDRAAAIIKSEDGQAQYFSWNVYAPLTCPEIALGTSLTVTAAGKEYATGEVKEFLKRQTHVRIRL